jgi:antitoxin ParD1/3/4
MENGPMSNTSLHFSLPTQLRDFIERRVAEGGYANPSDYLRDLVRADQRRRAREKLDALLLEGLQSGPADEVTPAYLDEMTAEMAAVIERSRHSPS